MMLEIKNSLKVLQKGGIFIYPTDTVWGIGCDATNQDAVNRIIKLKGRTEKNGFISLIMSTSWLSRYVKDIPEVAYDLLEYNSKPLTIIFDEGKFIAKNVYGENSTVALRIPKYIFCQKLLEEFKRPIVSTSANFKNAATPKSFAEIDSKLLNSVDYIVDYDRKTICEQISTLMRLKTNGEFQYLRK